MKNTLRIAFVIAAYCLVALALNACGGTTTTTAPTATNQATAPANQTATSNAASAQSARPPAVAASPKPATGSSGEFVDTSRYDAEIKRLEERAKKNAADQQARIALAKAYTERGDALTGVRQYNAALGDYRRALRNDPNNEQARQMAGTIISIYKGMGREVPPEGQELQPLKQ